MNVQLPPARPASDMEALLDSLEYIERPRPRSLSELFQRLLRRSRELTGADAGVIYTFSRDGGGRQIEAVEAQFQDPRRGLEGFSLPANNSSIAGHVALSGRTIVEDDVYAIPPDRPYRFSPQGDQLCGYRSQSMLCFPLTNFESNVIAVVQLVNCRSEENGEIGPFPPDTVDVVELFKRLVGGAVERTMMVDRIRRQNRRLRNRSKKLAQQRAQIEDLQGQTEEAFRLSISLLARAAEIYDEGTGNHIVRVNEYSYFLARQLGMAPWFCDKIRYSAQLHDVGKIAVDTAVLKKTGTLSQRDREEMNRHPLYGYEILHPSARLRMAAEIALNHHEKWDGSGYPRGLEGEEIPLSARIVQIADVYDALRSPRHYKGAIDHAAAVDVMLHGDSRIEPKGHFDPDLLEVFARCHAGFDEIWRKFADE